MLPFFRKIRWRLAKDNQFFKYSRYAVGEIILVVIGILIALQINNWNEERKRKQKLGVYVKTLREDLIRDTINLNSFLRTSERIIRQYSEVKVQIERVDINLDSIIHIFVKNRTWLTRLKPTENTTFNSLMSTGDIELFPQEQINVLMTFYDQIEVDYYMVRDRNIRTQNLFYDFWRKYGFLTKGNKEMYMYKMLRKSLDEDQFVKDYDILVHYYLRMQEDRFQVEKLLNLTNKTLNTLNVNN